MEVFRWHLPVPIVSCRSSIAPTEYTLVPAFVVVYQNIAWYHQYPCDIRLSSKSVCIRARTSSSRIALALGNIRKPQHRWARLPPRAQCGRKHILVETSNNNVAHHFRRTYRIETVPTPRGACYYMCIVQYLHDHFFTAILCRGGGSQPPVNQTPSRPMTMLTSTASVVLPQTAPRRSPPQFPLAVHPAAHCPSPLARPPTIAFSGFPPHPRLLFPERTPGNRMRLSVAAYPASVLRR